MRTPKAWPNACAAIKREVPEFARENVIAWLLAAAAGDKAQEAQPPGPTRLCQLACSGSERRGAVAGPDILSSVSTRSHHEPLETVRHQLRPLFDRVVVKELDQDRVRRSGLVVPPGSHDPPPQQGIVLAVGPGLDWWEQAGVEMPVEPGDHVVFPASAGAWVEVDEERLLVCRVGELLGVLESA
jgi:chaperonin GroES